VSTEIPFKTVDIVPYSKTQNVTGMMKPVNLLSATGATGPTGTYPVIIQGALNDPNNYPVYAQINPVDSPLVPGIPTKILQGALVPATIGGASGQGPTIDMNFTTKQYLGLSESDITCVRASVGYAFDTFGNAILFPANTPRITNKGLLSEIGVVNLLVPSVPVPVVIGASAGWTGPNASIGPPSVPSPDGLGSGTPVYDSPANATHQIFPVQSPTMVPGTTYTFSAYLRPGIQQNPKVQLQNGAGTSFVGAVMNLTGAGSVGTTGAGGANGATLIGARCQFVGPTGPAPWYLCEVTGQMSTGANSLAVLFPNGGASYSGSGITGGAVFYVWNTQIEINYYASSPIMTTTGSVTRASDTCTIGSTGSPAPLLVANPSGLSIYCAAIPLGSNVPSANQSAFAVSDGSANNRMILFRNAAANSNAAPILLSVRAGQPSQITVVGGGFASPNLTKAAIGATGGLAAAAANGVTGAPLAPTGPPSGVNQIQLGLNGAIGGPLNGYVQRAAVWTNTGLTQNQVAAITAGNTP
jgi:hypothetical protein